MDKGLIKLLSEGDSKTIESIYRSNYYKVESFVLKNKGNKMDAQDIFQKALMQLIVRYRKEAFSTTNFQAYLFTICKNLWRRELQKQKKRVTNPDFSEHIDDNLDNAFAIYEQKRWDIFDEALLQLSANCKKVLELFFSKMSYPEIVKTMNYSSDLVLRQRIFKCKQKLKEIIHKDKRFDLFRDQ